MGHPGEAARETVLGFNPRCAGDSGSCGGNERGDGCTWSELEIQPAQILPGLRKACPFPDGSRARREPDPIDSLREPTGLILDHVLLSEATPGREECTGDLTGTSLS